MSVIFFMRRYVFNCISLLYHPNIICVSLVCQSYIHVCHSYTIDMYLHAIRMSFVCHSYVTRMYSYVTLIYSYVTRMFFYHEPSKSRRMMFIKRENSIFLKVNRSG